MQGALLDRAMHRIRASADPNKLDPEQILHTVVAFPRTDGGVCFVCAFHNSARFKGESDEAFIWRRALLDVPSGRPFKMVPASEVPFQDRTFRDCWTMSFDDPDGHGGPYGRQNAPCDFGPRNPNHRYVFDHREPIAHDPATNELVGIDLGRAKTIHKNRIRLTAWWAAPDVEDATVLDAQVMAAMEGASSVSRVSALYDIWPACLAYHKGVWAHCYGQNRC